MKLTKIVATIAGNGCTPQLIQDLFDRGMNVVRLNTAHMSVEELEEAVKVVRSVSKNLAVMVDTKGPNIRTCGIEKPIELKKGERILVSGVKGEADFCVNYAPFVEEVPVGSGIICDDGAAAFEVIGKEKSCLVLQARFDCTIQDRKSINVPNVSLHAPALTEKDKLFIKESVRLGVDIITHSFVRNVDDIAAVRAELGEGGKDIAIIAKIENREGVDNIDDILKASDGIMVARGDLGIEIPLEQIPQIQKMLIDKARRCAKPVITATQMLQSMENSPLPTRAEVNDVANAVYDGTDAVMLSGETAHGKFPREAVAMMQKIVLQAENAPKNFLTDLDVLPESQRETAYILGAAVESCEYLPVKAIICASLSGLSARACSATRKRVPLVVATPRERTLRQLALSFGVYPFLTDYNDDPFVQAKDAINCIIDQLEDNDLIMILTKNTSKVERDNLLCLSRVKDLVEA